MPTFDAIGSVATDMAATLAFYRRLGLDIPAEADGDPHVEVAVADGFRIMSDTVATVQSFRDHQPPTGGRSVGFAFRCASATEVDEVFDRLTAAGHPFELAPFDAFWGQRYATVLDPDGNPVDLYAPLEDAGD